jgi:hypothetical protein
MVTPTVFNTKFAVSETELFIVIIRGVLVLAVVPVHLENLYRVLDAVAESVTWVPDK